MMINIDDDDDNIPISKEVILFIGKYVLAMSFSLEMIDGYLQ